MPRLSSISRLAIAPLLLGLAACSDSATAPATPALTTIEVTGTNSLRVNETSSLSASGKDQQGASFPTGTLAWSSSDTTAATVTSSGTVTARRAGSVTITARSGGVSGTFALTISGSLHSGRTITANETWTLANSPHVVTGLLTIAGSGSPTLTIEAGAVVRLGTSAEINVGGASSGGALVAAGTATQKVTFVADAATPAAGHWFGINFREGAGSSSSLTHVNIAHCGRSGASCIEFFTGQAGITLANVAIDQTAGVGVELSSTSRLSTTSTALSVSNAALAPVIAHPAVAGSIPTGGTFTSNARNVVQLTGGTVAVTQTWPNLGIPYAVTGDVFVEGTASPVLTLPAGTALRFGTGRSFYVGSSGGTASGALVTNGTASQKVTFVADAATPAAGHWYGVYLRANASPATSLTHTEIRHCGQGTFPCLDVASAQAGITLNNVTVAQSAHTGVEIAGTSRLNAASTVLSVSDAAQPPIVAHPNVAGALPAGGTFTNNARNVVQLTGGTVALSQTWPNLGIPYAVNGDIFVESAGTPAILTIPAGTALRFGSGRSFYVGSGGGTASGALVTNGTASQKVTFVADAATPAAGHWYGVYLRANASPATSLTHTEIRHCGQGTFPCLDVASAQAGITLNNVTVAQSAHTGVEIAGTSRLNAASTVLSVSDAAQPPIVAHPNVAGALPAGGTFTNNARNVVQLTGGTLSVSQTWPNLGIPYAINGDVFIEGTGAPVLTLPAGTSLRFGASVSFYVGASAGTATGALVALGTSSNRVVFTADATTPAAGHWFGIFFRTNASTGSSLDFTTVEFGGRSGFPNIDFTRDIGQTVRNSIIRSSGGCGIRRNAFTGTWATDFTAAGLGNTFSSNTGLNQCGP